MTSSLPTLSADGVPPPIPRARLDWAGTQTHPLVVWVRTGTADVYVDGAAAFHLTVGQGAWLPANGCEHRGIATEPGAVVFPLWLDPRIGPLSEPSRFEVPDGWQDWLIQYFNLLVTPLAGRGYSQEAITTLLSGRGSRPSAPERTAGNASSRAHAVTAMPNDRGARVVAEELLRDPALDLTIEEWASRVLSSPRTLLRHFRADTGLTFQQWRLRCRLSAAVELLAAGDGVDQVATRVGFTSRGGFAYAFRRQFGSTPYQFGRTLSASHAIDGLSQRTMAARRADHLVEMVRDGRASPDAPELLPATRTPSHTNDSHVLSWVCRGSGYLDIGDRCYERERGVATWIPAGVEHVTGLRQGAVSLPVGDAGTGDLQLTEPLQVRFSPAWDDYLMFCSVSARSMLRPAGYDPAHILDLFTEQVAAQRALSVPTPTDPLARAAAMDYLRSMGTTGESALDLSADVHRTFREQTGMTFSRWRYAARMRVARDLLIGGARSSAVARRVGYAHLPTFSAAFARFHGLSPREYQQSQTALA